MLNSLIRRLPVEWQYDIDHLRNRHYYQDMVQRIVERQGIDGETYVDTMRSYVEHRVIFIHVPKAGGQSVKAALFGQYHLDGGHTTAIEYRRIFGRRYWRYFKFTFVRNPYHRLVSAYRYLAAGGHPVSERNRRFSREVIAAYDGFEDFVLHWLTPGRTHWPEPHFRPQTEFLEINGQLAVDFIGRQETMSKDFKIIAERMGVEATLPRVNITPGKHRQLSEYYTCDAIVQRVQSIYRRDFELLGYSEDLRDAIEGPLSGVSFST